MSDELTPTQMPPTLFEAVDKFLNENKPDDLNAENASEKATEFINGLIKKEFLSLSFVNTESPDEPPTIGISVRGKDFTIGVTPHGDNEHYLFVLPTVDSEYEGEEIVPVALLAGLDTAVLTALVLRNLIDGENWRQSLNEVLGIAQ